ncbi:MAG: hypothetical protein H6Q89_3832 [Myxococcaceae bacterium]|nr:hypothetical protein [Myxococcaceae bacterium]
MPITRTEAELQSAIETMFRVRAVESPPDEQGARTIWHRGHKGADLVTWVDAFGRVTRQELYLFDDCLVWEKASGVRTGQSEDREGSRLTPAPGMIAFDSDNDDERIVRARKALGPYGGADKFILHARGLVGGLPPGDDEVTRGADAVNLAERVALRQESERRAAALAKARRLRLIAVTAGCALIGLGLLIWIFGLGP